MMSWTHHIPHHEREDLEKKAINDLASLVRMGFWAGAWKAGHKAREQQKLPRLSLGQEMQQKRIKKNIEKQFNDRIEGVVKDLYKKAGKPWINYLTWLEEQYTSLKKEAESIFVSH